MSALSDIQRALNVVRRIANEEAYSTKLSALALMHDAMGDVLTKLRDTDKPKAQPRARAPKPPTMPVPKPAAPSPQSPNPPKPTPRPFTEPEIATEK